MIRHGERRVAMLAASDQYQLVVRWSPPWLGTLLNLEVASDWNRNWSHCRRSRNRPIWRWPSREEHDVNHPSQRRTTSAEFLEPNAMQLTTACSMSASRPVLAT